MVVVVVLWISQGKGGDGGGSRKRAGVGVRWKSGGQHSVQVGDGSQLPQPSPLRQSPSTLRTRVRIFLPRTSQDTMRLPSLPPSSSSPQNLLLQLCPLLLNAIFPTTYYYILR